MKLKLFFSLLLVAFSCQLWAQNDGVIPDVVIVAKPQAPSLLSLGYTQDNEGNSAGVAAISTPRGFIGLLQVGKPYTLDAAQFFLANELGKKGWTWGVGAGANVTLLRHESLTLAFGPQLMLVSPITGRWQLFTAVRPVNAYQFKSESWRKFTVQFSTTVSWQFSARLPLLVTGYYAYDGVNDLVSGLGGHISALGLTLKF